MPAHSSKVQAAKGNMDERTTFEFTQDTGEH